MNDEERKVHDKQAYQATALGVSPTYLLLDLGFGLREVMMSYSTENCGRINNLPLHGVLPCYVRSRNYWDHRPEPQPPTPQTRFPYFIPYVN